MYICGRLAVSPGLRSSAILVAGAGAFFHIFTGVFNRIADVLRGFIDSFPGLLGGPVVFASDKCHCRKQQR